MKKDNTTQVLSLFMNALGVPVIDKSIANELAKHPESSSFLAISDVLNYLRVPNAAYGLSFDELLQAEVPVPFIAHTAIKDEEFVLVTGISDMYVTISNLKVNNYEISVNDFKGLYGGSILVAEKEEGSGEPDYAVKRGKEVLNNLRVPVVVAGCALLFFTFLLLNQQYTTAFNWPVALLTLFKTAGLITSVLLLMQSIDSNNPMINKLCRGGGNINCNAILASDAAKISEELSWSEVGFFYFSGTWLVLLFNAGNNGILQLLALLNIVSLPYTFYSIYYQWRIAKQWCLFCCAVQALLWLEFFAFLPYFPYGGLHVIDSAGWGGVISGLALPILAWIFVKPHLQNSTQLVPLKKELNEFKYNTGQFEKGLNESEKYKLPDEDDIIVLGNREAEKIITVVSNLYCKPCAKAHKALDEWLAGRDDIKLQLLFTPDKKDPDAQVAQHFMALKLTRDEQTLKQALNDWYSRKYKDYVSLVKHYPVNAYDPGYYMKYLKRQRNWLRIPPITATPTLFINGRKVPKNYNAEDIKYFI
jgi:uncharacterized membrane protein